jgi:uncharacterized protein YndB with AHSA1/START domain
MGMVEEAVMTENGVQSKAAMLIRKPVAEVFEAFVNPAITTQVWFSKSSGPLETGKTVTWEWELYNASADVLVKVVEPNQRIVIEWDGYRGKNVVEWTFTDMGDGTTFVRITESGFTGTPTEIAQQAVDSTGGFTLVLCGLKALLEHNVNLNLIADRFPPGLPEGAG